MDRIRGQSPPRSRSAKSQTRVKREMELSLDGELHVPMTPTYGTSHRSFGSASLDMNDALKEGQDFAIDDVMTTQSVDGPDEGQIDYDQIFSMEVLY